VEIFNSVEAALLAYPDSYVAFEKLGDCMICAEHKDLRAGSCWECSGLVSGEPIKGGHRLWETSKPENTWYVGDITKASNG